MRKFQAALCGLLILCGTAFAQSEKPVKVTGADAVANTSLSEQTAADGTTVLPVFGGFVFNGTTWDRMPGTTAGVKMTGSVSQGTAFGSAGNPVLIGGLDSSGNVAPIRCGTINGTGNGCPISIVTNQGTADGLSNANVGAFPQQNGTGNYVLMAPLWFNGTTWDRQFYCSNVAKLNALAATTTEIVPLAASKKIRVCSISISNNNATATTLKMVEGTGTNCGTGQTNVTALWNIGATSTAPIFMNWGSSGAIITTTAADALCFTSSAASSLEITITYDQH